ncbi:gag/pol protein [Cucumis melo var. makuwa]|uniref:Gag/pol protein n=1 Tax=Cucumis melo var. makuwa TaxID=1194695 RepID=A0A5A7TNG3_CUCMM|nr:gag/pol protein [Cucumis melo var. makuwa]TYK29774.1 gag/pol protein [Cucumis melo var. makuwa]
MTKRPFTGKGYRAKEPLELIHSDLCGPMNVKARGDFKYFISFIDDYSNKKIKILRSDRGGEYMDLRFQDYMVEHGIQSQLSVPVETAVHILNNVPSKSVFETPFELWRGRKPSLSHFRIWGCPVHVLVINHKKLEPYSRVVDEVGPSSRVDETTTTGQSHPSQSLRMTRRSVRIVSQPNRYLGLTETQVVIPDNGVQDPLSFKQAMNDVDKDQWVKAMDLEMESMYFNSVWELVDLPEGVKPIGCKRIYKRKRDSAGKVQTFKARLVAKGYTQREGVDYEETFSPVAMLKCIRILLSIATFYDYEIWQMDVKIAFLNGNLEESIFMSKPEFITQAQVQMKDLGEAQYVLRIQIISDPVGSLMYAMLCTRPDICYAVGIVSRHQSNPSIKQGCITDSTMEAEYVAACEAAKEAVWLRKFLHDLKVVANMNLPITLYCNNSGAVANSKEPRNHKRGKHIERKYHLIREIVQPGDVIVTKIASEHNITYPFTKTLTTKVFEGHLESLGLRDIYIRDCPLICTGESGQIADSYAYHFGNKIEWGAGNIITQDGIHSFPPLG